jgi:L-alanine-DL-glutamate epimerase-like enolase superfamily enzyme
MKITDIEIIPIYPRIAARNAAYKARFRDLNRRVVFKVHTDAGIVGYGDYRSGAPPRSSVEPLIGRDPFEYLYNDLHPGLGMALYDVMGKYLEVPAYKLMGQKVREAVSVAAWTRPASPERLAEEVQRAVEEGYTHFKMHSCEYYDVLEQTRAVEEVAPPGFKFHWDFNHNRTLISVLPLINELEQFRVVGFIEDPIIWRDIDGWRALRQRVGLPIIMHVPQLGGAQEVIHGCADAYMIGGSIGNTLRAGYAYGAANMPVLLQLGSGTVSKALAMHMGAVLPTATLHSVNLDDQYEEDITRERIPVIHGCSPVPQGPGLGVEIDEEALARAAANPPTEIPRHLAVVRLTSGHKIYYPSLGAVNVERMTGKEEGTIRGINLDIRDDDGSAEFAHLYERATATGGFIA